MKHRKLNIILRRCVSVMLVLLLFVPVLAFGASALTSDEVQVPLDFIEYNLPFPHPSTFGDHYAAVIFQSANRSSGNLLYEMDVVVFEPENNESTDNVNQTFLFGYDNNEVDFSILCVAPAGIIGTFMHYRIRYYDGYSYYTVRAVKAESVSDGGYYTYTTSTYDGSDSSREINIKSVAIYGESTLVVDNLIPDYDKRNINYSFHGEISTSYLQLLILSINSTITNTGSAITSEIDEANGKLDSANSKLDQANSKLDSANSKLDEANSNLDEANSKLDTANDHLDHISDNTDSISTNTRYIRLYTNQILELLQDEFGAFGELTTEASTTNSDVSEFQQEEESLMNDNFSAANSVLTNATEADYFNKGSRANAMKFLSAQIEYFSGNDTTADYSRAPNAMKKISAAIALILGLGLASFVIGLVNRRKS